MKDSEAPAAETDTAAVKRKWYRRAAFVGAALGLVCHLLPPEYRTVCQAIVGLCTGGL